MTKPSPNAPSALMRILSRSLTLAVTGLIVLLAAALVVTGSDLIAVRAADTSAQAIEAPTAVALSPIELRTSYKIAASFTGQIEPAQRTELGFESGGTLAALLVDEGDRVTKGQILARLDIRALQADRAAQQAALEAAIARRDLARLTADRQTLLAERDFASTQRGDEARFQLAVAEAEITRSKAALEGIDVALAKAEITAPYAGIITARHVDAGARLAPGQTILGLQDNQTLLRVGLPEDLSDRLNPGDAVDIRVQGRSITGKVQRLRPDLDPATRTRAALIALPDTLIPVTGTLAELTLARSVQGAGAWVPLSALSEGLDGLWTVFVLPEDRQTLIRVAVTLEHVSDDRAYIAGALPDGAQLVTAGTHRLSAGLRVAPLSER